MKTIDQIRAARRVSVPILAVQTPDQAATVAVRHVKARKMDV